jgi:hypothetical protein
MEFAGTPSSLRISRTPPSILDPEFKAKGKIG